MNELKERWKAELNAFWKKVLNVSLTVGGAALGIVTANQIWNLQSLGVAPIIFTVCGYILTFCGALGLAAKLTK
jgi:hypothetical protein